MEHLKICIECKLSKPLIDFEKFGRTYRRICRVCRGSTISGLTINNVTSAVENLITTHSDNNLRDIELKLNNHITIIEQQLSILKSSNQSLFDQCKHLSSQNTSILDSTNNFNSNILHIIDRLDDIVVNNRDPVLQSNIMSISNDVKALGNSLSVIYNNLKPSRTTSPIVSPAVSPIRPPM